MASTRKIFVSRLRWTDCAGTVRSLEYEILLIQLFFDLGTLKKYFSKFGKVSFANVIYVSLSITLWKE